MPRKSKDENEKTEIKKVKKSTASSTKKASTSKPTSSKKVEKEPKDKSVSNKDTTKKASAKKSSKKSTSKTKKVVIKKLSNKKTTSKKTASKKSTAKKTTKKAVAKKVTKLSKVEYYDLPQKYNKTVIKLLAQTPKTLFVYWEISDDDINRFKEQYGDNFFETTKPVLIVHNDTLNYSFEVDINDFANSWYLHVNDSKSDYRIELGRRPFSNDNNSSNGVQKPDYIYVTSSNEIESPNDHILFNNSQKMVYFRNVKTNAETAKPFATLTFIRNMGKIYEIYDLYQELYKDKEDIENFSNPSSHTSSNFR